jgi:hypothetical protein
MRWGLALPTFISSSILVGGIFCACDDIERDAPARYYVPPPPEDGGGGNATSSGTSGNSPIVDSGDGGEAGDASQDAALVFDPATLTLTGWWRASFVASPWVGNASAGGSAGRDLTEPTTPPTAGPPIKGLAPAAFDGTNDKIASNIAVSTFLGAAAWEVHGLFSADAAPARTIGAPYLSPALVTDSASGFFYISYSDGGVMAGHFDGAFREILSPCPTGGLHVFQAWFDGTKLNLQIDGGIPATPVVAGAAVFGAGLLKVGANYNGTATFNGRIVEVLTAAQMLGDVARSNVRKYFNQRYATAFQVLAN